MKPGPCSPSSPRWKSSLLSSAPISLRVLDGLFAVCRLDPTERVPENLPLASLLSITHTPRELSIVCRESRGLPGTIESGWRCLVVDGTLAFDQVGILASLAQPLAEAGVSIFVLSTYDTDYLMVKEELLETSLEALQAAGHTIL
jgi:hypothetical protein